MAIARKMFAAFQACEMIEPVNIEIDVHDDVQYTLRGFHTVSEERLARLEGPALETLNTAGFLRGAFLVVQSLNNIGRLIELKRVRVLEIARAADAAGMNVCNRRTVGVYFGRPEIGGRYFFEEGATAPGGRSRSGRCAVLSRHVVAPGRGSHGPLDDLEARRLRAELLAKLNR